MMVPVFRYGRMALGLALLACADACTIVSTAEDKALREARSQDIDPGRYVELLWTGKVVPALEKQAVSPADLATNLPRGIDRADGRQSGEGSPWIFVIQSQGIIDGADRASQHGTVSATFETPGGPRKVVIQTGPYVSGTTIRDALDFVRFNDFKDQIVFAGIGNALTDKGLRESASLARARTGTRVEVLGTLALRDAGDPWVLTPVRARILP